MKWWYIFLSTVAALIPKTQLSNNVFTRHDAQHMYNIFDMLYKFSCAKQEGVVGVDKQMYSEIGQNLYKARDYCVKVKDNNMVYLGWTPLCSYPKVKADRMLVRNDNTIPEGMVVDNKLMDYRNIPLYFVCLEVVPKDRVLSVEKIIHNPSIDVNVDVSLLKYHLSRLADDSNTTLAMHNLKHQNSGRWFFEFFHTTASHC